MESTDIAGRTRRTTFGWSGSCPDRAAITAIAGATTTAEFGLTVAVAQFEYGRGGNGGNNTGAAVAAGILGALMIGSAIANSKSDNDDGVAANRRDYYFDGYRHGQRDWDNDRRPDYQRYLDRFPREYETDFSTGYNDGYNNRPSKYR